MHLKQRYATQILRVNKNSNLYKLSELVFEEKTSTENVPSLCIQVRLEPGGNFSFHFQTPVSAWSLLYLGRELRLDKDNNS